MAVEPMTDAEIAAYCGFKAADDQVIVTRIIASMTPTRRALLEKMRQIEMSDATDGLIPMPSGVILNRVKS